MKTMRGLALALTAWAICLSAAAQWTVGNRSTLTQAFVANMSAAYTATSYGWHFMTSCDARDCFGSNPDSPYGAPDFNPGGSRPMSAKQLQGTDALVLIMETPPPARYFGVTPYIFKRYYPSAMPLNPTMTPGFVPVFESLTDTFNMATAGTTGSPTPGVNPFTQLAVFVITADSATWQDVAAQLVSLGYPAQAINQIALPVNAVPLRMGTTLGKDSFSVLLRTAYPDDPALMASYIERAPVDVVHLAPRQTRGLAALPTPTYRQPGNGHAEPGSLAVGRDALVNQLLARYGASYTITESAVVDRSTKNYFCVAAGVPCNGDNPDAIYTADVGQNDDYTPADTDRLLVVGVNHDAFFPGTTTPGTGKTTYFSHSLVNATNLEGVYGISDRWLAGTALAMAGITNPNDPRYATYQQLYAFTVSYECAGDPQCVTIPQPSDGVPGVKKGDPLQVTGRLYVDPATKTRPDSREVIFHRVFILTHK